jgi:hypothetical protein
MYGMPWLAVLKLLGPHVRRYHGAHNTTRTQLAFADSLPAAFCSIFDPDGDDTYVSLINVPHHGGHHNNTVHFALVLAAIF